MSDPVSIAVGYWLGLAALRPYARPGTAVSVEAQAVTVAASAVVRNTETSLVLFGDRAAALSELRALAIDCAEQGWDGDEAFAVEPDAVRNAEEFIAALPEGVAMPEFAPEPDGSVSLDWIESRSRLFSLSIGSSSRLAYAWLDGTDSGHGVARFDGANIPPRVLEGIQSIMGHGYASLRAA